MLAPDNTAAEELLNAMAGIPFSDPAYGRWWASEDGTWLYAEIARRIGGPLIASSDALYGVSFDPEDVANTAVTLLRRPEVHPYITTADDPWGYLASVIRRQLRRDAGTYFRVPLDDHSTSPPEQHEPPDTPGLRDSVERTVAYLRTHAAPEYAEQLEEAVWYFAERGHHRLSHLYTNATKDPYLKGLGFGRPQILAVANAVLGSRPAHGHNSVLGGFLASPEFDPDLSVPHRLAIRKFASRMNTGESPEKRISA